MSSNSRMLHQRQSFAKTHYVMSTTTRTPSGSSVILLTSFQLPTPVKTTSERQPTSIGDGNLALQGKGF
ncbi:hypothetical protein SLA2020_053600 [Shorea laevis]